MRRVPRTARPTSRKKCPAGEEDDGERRSVMDRSLSASRWQNREIAFFWEKFSTVEKVENVENRFVFRWENARFYRIIGKLSTVSTVLSVDNSRESETCAFCTNLPSDAFRQSLTSSSVNAFRRLSLLFRLRIFYEFRQRSAIGARFFAPGKVQVWRGYLKTLAGAVSYRFRHGGPGGFCSPIRGAPGNRPA